MDQSENTKNVILEHFKKYPKLKIVDLFKFIHQSSFGCEHMVSSIERAVERVSSEASAVVKFKTPLIEQLDGNYSRVSLEYLSKGLTADTLGKLFYRSAKTEADGTEQLNKKIDALRDLITQNILPFEIESFESELALWKDQGYPPIHHSNEFRKEYSPSYRVITNDLVAFLPLFARLDDMLKQGEVILAIEGGSASGKSTLGDILFDVYDCALFHMDDYFLRPEQRTSERFAEPGGNVDRERFSEEVLLPLSKGEEVIYRPFNCSTLSLSDPIKSPKKRLTVIEGAYSMHPELYKYYDISLFIDISSDLQIQRINKRNSPDMAKRFFDEWIPLEKIYFEHFNVKNSCELIIEIK